MRKFWIVGAILLLSYTIGFAEPYNTTNFENVSPMVDSTYNLGTSGNEWLQLNADNITCSSITFKSQGGFQTIIGSAGVSITYDIRAATATFNAMEVMNTSVTIDGIPVTPYALGVTGASMKTAYGVQAATGVITAGLTVGAGVVVTGGAMQVTATSATVTGASGFRVVSDMIRAEAGVYMSTFTVTSTSVFLSTPTAFSIQFSSGAAAGNSQSETPAATGILKVFYESQLPVLYISTGVVSGGWTKVGGQ